MPNFHCKRRRQKTFIYTTENSAVLPRRKNYEKLFDHSRKIIAVRQKDFDTEYQNLKMLNCQKPK
jgi:hypothetical protein